MTEPTLYSNPVPYYQCNEDPGRPFWRLYRYKVTVLATGQTFSARPVWVRTEVDFYKLLAHWNQASPNYKYTEDT